MAKKTIAGVVTGIVALERNGREIVIVRTANTQAVFSKRFVETIAKNIGLTLGQLSKYAKQYKVSFDAIDVVAGEVITDRKGENVKDRNGNDVVATKDHTRFENLSFELREEFMAMNLQADAIGSAIASQFSAPQTVAKIASVERVAEPAAVDAEEAAIEVEAEAEGDQRL